MGQNNTQGGFDMNGMLALMTMLSQQQSQNIESALQPQNKIPMALNNNGFGQRGAGGIQSQYDWEAQKRQNTTQQMQDMIEQQKLRNEMAGLKGQGQPQQGGGGIGGFFKGLFGGGQPQTQSNQVPQQQNPGGTRFTFGPQPAQQQYDDTTFFQNGQSEMKKQNGWDWNDMPGGRPFGMPENPTAPEINPQTGQANYDPIARGNMNISMNQLQQRLNKSGQRTISYSPPQSKGTPYVKTSGAPKTTVVPGQKTVNPNSNPVVVNQRQTANPNSTPLGQRNQANNPSEQDPLAGLSMLMSLLQGNQPPMSPISMRPQEPIQQQNPFGSSDPNQNAVMQTMLQNLQVQEDPNYGSMGNFLSQWFGNDPIIRAVKGMFPATNPNYRRDVKKIKVQ